MNEERQNGRIENWRKSVRNSPLNKAGRNRSCLITCLAIASLSFIILPGGDAEAAPSAWTVTPSPNLGSNGDTLNGISCVTSTDCVAVGDYTTSAGIMQTLIEAWNGTAWSVSPSPNPNTGGDLLNSVYCTSATFCEAVGYEGSTSGSIQNLIESWNGTAWSVTPSPDVGSSDQLLGIFCTSSTSCMAVGSADQPGPLAEAWNGTAWSIVPTASSSGGYASLSGVWSASSSSCVAVGNNFVTSSSATKTLVESWKGTAWFIIPSPNPKGPYSKDDTLFGVWCASSSYCVAVGSSLSGETVPVIEAWNGSTWSAVSSPALNGFALLSGVWCASATDCVAVGDHNAFTLVEAWNGSTWSVVRSPGRGEANWLNTVSCLSSADCVSVGFYEPLSTPYRTLIETGSNTAAPKIKSFTPASGPPGATVTIAGVNLSGVTVVTFNGSEATITKDTATKIKVTVPTGATTGKINVTTPGGSAKSASTFTIT